MSKLIPKTRFLAWRAHRNSDSNSAQYQRPIFRTPKTPRLQSQISARAQHSQSRIDAFAGQKSSVLACSFTRAAAVASRRPAAGAALVHMICAPKARRLPPRRWWCWCSPPYPIYSIRINASLLPACLAPNWSSDHDTVVFLHINGANLDPGVGWNKKTKKGLRRLRLITMGVSCPYFQEYHINFVEG
jgi:hypothetical protein